MGGLNLKLRPLYLRAKTLLHTDQAAWWTPESVWTFGEERNIITLRDTNPKLRSP